MSRLALAVIALLLSAPAYAADYPILGNWMIVKWMIAPWVDAKGKVAGLEAAAKARLNMLIDFEPNRVTARDPVLNCTNAEYERTKFAPDALFQGMLPAPNQARLAQSLGLPPGDVAGFDLGCSTGLFSFHFADRSTLLFALDDVIYTMNRQ